MILAIAALLVHLPAVPQGSLPSISSIAAITERATIESASGETVADGSRAAIDPASTAMPLTSSADQPVVVVTVQPGRLTPAPVAPASTDPAAGVPALFPFSPAAAAFVASSPAAVHSREQEERRKRRWAGLSIAQGGAATFDAWTTRRVVSSGGQELNPMLRPFAGNASLYAAIQVAPLLLDYVGRHMMNSRHGWERHTWWVPQGLGTAMSVASGIHNLGVQ